MIPIRARCRACGLELVFLEHERTGKPAPIQLEAVEGGNVLPLDSEGEPVAAEAAQRYRVLGPAAKRAWYARPDAPNLWVSHFVTCKEAPHFRDLGKKKT
jgi:hypothetical protein